VRTWGLARQLIVVGGLTTAIVLGIPVGTWLGSMLHWMVNVPQQLRVAAAAPDTVPIVLGLHQSTIYLGISTGGLVGTIGYGLAGIGGAALTTGLLALAALRWSIRTRAGHHKQDRPARTRPSRTQGERS
jgi:MFS transporter, DHA1 family, inner membrane transport protein